MVHVVRHVGMLGEGPRVHIAPVVVDDAGLDDVPGPSTEYGGS